MEEKRPQMRENNLQRIWILRGVLYLCRVSKACLSSGTETTCLKLRRCISKNEWSFENHDRSKLEQKCAAVERPCYSWWNKSIKCSRICETRSSLHCRWCSRLGMRFLKLISIYRINELIRRSQWILWENIRFLFQKDSWLLGLLKRRIYMQSKLVNQSLLSSRQWSLLVCLVCVGGREWDMILRLNLSNTITFQCRRRTWKGSFSWQWHERSKLLRVIWRACRYHF